MNKYKIAREQIIMKSKNGDIINEQSIIDVQEELDLSLTEFSKLCDEFIIIEPKKAVDLSMLSNRIEGIQKDLNIEVTINEINFKIIDHLGTFSLKGRKWEKKLSKIKWGKGSVRYDIRKWGGNYEKIGKGITLDIKELRELYRIIGDELTFLDEKN